MDNYRFTPAFERHVVWHCIWTPAFGKFLEYLADDFWSTPETTLIGRVLRAWGEEHHTVPGNHDLFIQRLQREHNEGRVSAEDLELTVNWVFVLLATLTHPAPAANVEAELRANVVALQQFKASEELVKQARSRGPSMAKAARKIIEAEQIGLVTPPKPPVRDLSGLLSSMETGADLDLLSTGTICDQVLGGGIERGSLTLFLGNTNSGKSFLLLQCIAACLIQGKNACLTFLEGTEGRVVTRLVALLSGMKQAEVRKDKEAAIIAVAERWPNLGKFAIFEVNRVGSLAADITKQWDDEAVARGIQWDEMGLDYGDLVEGVDEVLATKVKEYDRAKAVYGYLYAYATTKNGRVLSPTQSQRLADEAKEAGLNSLADSHHKARIADTILAINRKRKPPPSYLEAGHIPSDKDQFVEITCVKHRNEFAGLRTGVVKADLDRAVLLPNQVYFPPYDNTVML